jgi:hypothetical protein
MPGLLQKTIQVAGLYESRSTKLVRCALPRHAGWFGQTIMDMGTTQTLSRPLVCRASSSMVGIHWSGGVVKTRVLDTGCVPWKSPSQDQAQEGILKKDRSERREIKKCFEVVIWY